MGSGGALKSLDALRVPNDGTLLLDSCSLLGGAGLWVADRPKRPLNGFREVLLRRVHEYSFFFSAPQNGVGIIPEVFVEVDRRIRSLRGRTDSEVARALDELEDILYYKTAKVEDVIRDAVGSRFREYAQRLLELENKCLEIGRYQVKGKRMSLPDARLVVAGSVLSECDGGCSIVSDDRGLHRGVTILGEQKNHFKDLAYDLGVHPKALGRRSPVVYAWGKDGPYKVREKRVRRFRPKNN